MRDKRNFFINNNFRYNIVMTRRARIIFYNNDYLVMKKERDEIHIYVYHLMIHMQPLLLPDKSNIILFGFSFIQQCVNEIVI